MKILNLIKSAYLSFENLLMTSHNCIGCKAELPDNTKFSLCQNCKNCLCKISEPVCIRCGDEISGKLKLCDVCKEKDYAFTSNRSIFYYGEVEASIIKGLKFNSRKYYAKPIAELMTTDLSSFDGIDFLTFVPINSARRKTRGFNQAEEIANEISKITNIAVLPALIKNKSSIHQTGLTQKQRLENLKNSFSLDENYRDQIRGKTILIIDDVFTTGSTLNECSLTLLQAKPKRIQTLTFAKTRFNVFSSSKNQNN